ncbi:MAG: MerR family transcriptional regulator [Desulfobulbus sp.]|nr:MAG: MerR family transcriptional regulator [Desulfobulbus sp.]
MTEKVTYITGTVLDEDTRYGLKELCTLCNIPAEDVQEMINEGLIDSRSVSPLQWRFTYTEIRRVLTAVRLQRDLRVNLPGCALVLDLLDELEELRQLHRR